jgi:hypothetical protein
MTSSNDFVIVPIAGGLINRQRSIAGTSEVATLSATGGEPLRCCLRNAVPAEPLILFNYEPPLPRSPYQEKGAVFAHANQCHSASELRTYPPDWRGRPQVLRSYDKRGWIHSATVHEGADPEGAIRAAFEDPDVVEVHSRNVAYGCFMFAIRRDEQQMAPEMASTDADRTH